MADLMTDGELLREYAERGSESAFGSLVERHLNLVFATALRGLNDHASAQEITQNVFTTLARKAVWLRGETSVAAWLHKAALMEVRLWWRGEFRRRRRQQTAAELGTLMKDEDSLLKALVSELDEALLALREDDRQALMLRYFEGRSHREIGNLLGAREDAVRMRISKALDRLTYLFRRRGYTVPAVATTVAALGSAAKAAPAELAQAAVRAALSSGSGGAATGLKLMLAKFMGLSKTQTAVLCLTLATAPAAWEWNAHRIALDRSAASQEKLAAVRDQLSQSSAEMDQLRTESARLDGAIADALTNQARYDAAAGKLATLKSRLRGLLSDGNYRWPDDLPYVRVPKSLLKSLDLLKSIPFSTQGTLSQTAQDFFGITAQEKAPTEQALANYWRGVLDMMTASAFQGNMSTNASGYVTNTVIVPPLGQPLQSLAEDTGAQLANILGPEREKLLFDGWDPGGIQVWVNNNPAMIAEQPQTFMAWVGPSMANAPPAYGGGWNLEGCCGMSTGGTSCSYDFMPKGIYTKFFAPWLEQNGIPAPTSFLDGPNE
jgi:RNA polymerase sigma factor (sigma-70 family)